MNPQDLKEIRDMIDDHISIGQTVDISSGELQVYQLNARNYWDLMIKDSNGNNVPLTSVTQYPQSGQIKGTLPQGHVSFEYSHAGFTDAEIQYYYEKSGKNSYKTALRLVEILLASAAKRFDYKAGIKDIKASQVFEHLKDLKASLETTIENEDPSNQYNSGIFVDRLHPAYTEKKLKNSWFGDISRR